MVSVFNDLKKARDRLIVEFSDGVISKDLQQNLTEIVDQYFRGCLEESETAHKLFKSKHPFTFVAVGGYGRKELCLHSDIDVFILFDSKVPGFAKELANEVFFPLWNLGLDLGYGIRNIKDCVSLTKGDFQVLTSMMDARFVCGDSPLYLSLIEAIQNKVIRKKSTAFTRWLDDRHKIREYEFGDASYLLEPHLKEGLGGLRDYHQMLWLARVYFDLREPRELEYSGRLSHNEYQELMKSLDFIWFVRNHLHLLTGRRNDRLGFEYQEKIADRLGFKGNRRILAVERFLGELHYHMASVKSLHRSFNNSQVYERKRTGEKDVHVAISDGLYVYREELFFISAAKIPTNPLLIMDIFEYSAVSGNLLSIEARRLVSEFTQLVTNDFRCSSNAVQGFLSIINSAHTFQTLDQMLETGFLAAFIPEFGKIINRVQFDAYHMFPVGRHSLETLRHLKTMNAHAEMLYMDIFSEIQNPERLFLAALFHDLGKTGKDHARKGTAIAKGILKRFAYDEEGCLDIHFLIEKHLLLAETAGRRDLSDEKTVVSCARIIGTIDRLNMLYLLTWADAMATGPRAWNSWIANLVQELYFKIRHILERKELATPGVSQKAETTRLKVKRLIEEGDYDVDFEKTFDAMTPRYLLNTDAHQIVRHLSLVALLREREKIAKSSSFVLDSSEDIDEGSWELVFLAKDRPGLFSDLAGVLTLNNINILAADIYTWQDGTAIDILRVSSPLDAMFPEETWQRVEKDLDSTFKGKLSLAYRLGQKARPLLTPNNKKPSRPTKIIVDNESSDFFTVIEVFADDRVGLLYEITRTLFDLRLDIHIAKIATKIDQIADVFYVRDLEGQKVEDPSQIKEIKGALSFLLV